jgi:CheY-like chemotaxis protein
MVAYSNPEIALKINTLRLEDKRIVIVEDDQPSIRYYETLLKSTGVSIQVFGNGKAFIDFICNNNEKIDLIFMDFLIPLINGIDCVRFLRKKKNNVPVIMVTGYSSEQTRTEAYLAGCNEFVLKPVFPEEIYMLLEKYFQQKVTKTLIN